MATELQDQITQVAPVEFDGFVWLLLLGALGFVAAIAAASFALYRFALCMRRSEASFRHLTSLWRFRRINRAVTFRPLGSDEVEGCAICLEVYQVGEELRVMNGCRHRFHAECVDGWVDSSIGPQSCPLCRHPLI
uniref:RING-type domain-containing protein n=1 Tax=Kalanchoe fedtschenkoi TaxID=63787 RepID=A0A7N0TQK1_KALFE